MVHTFSVLGCNIAVDVNSGAVHVLDQLSYDLLSAAGENPEIMPAIPGVDEKEAEKAWNELMALKEQGLPSRHCVFMWHTTAIFGANTALRPPAILGPDVRSCRRRLLWLPSIGW